MPVLLEKLTDLTEQDLKDLEKIYAEAPVWLFSEFGEREFVANRLADSSLQLYAGRFNDRLLAACWVQEQGDEVSIRWFNVRRETRGRGVGTRLLTLVCESYPDQTLTILCQPESASTALMHKCGFDQRSSEGDLQQWAREPQLTAR